MGILSSLIGAGSSLLSGVLSSKSSSKAQKKNAQLQREFAQNAIQWKVADAEKAGVHPLYALGAQTISAQPSYVGDTNLGAGIANAGQDIGRAIDANSSQTTRDRAYTEKVRALELTKMDLENQLLASSIAKNRAQLPPPLPTDKIKIGGVDIKPSPLWSDADTITQRYGEPMEWLYSPFVAAADLDKHLKDQGWYDAPIALGKDIATGFYNQGRDLYKWMFE